VIERSRRLVIAVWLAVTVGIAALLSSPMIFPIPPLWVRTLVPLLVVAGAIEEFRHNARYYMVFSVIGAWLLLVVVFLETVIGDREAYIVVGQLPPHSPLHSLNVLAQLAIAILVLLWVYWRKRHQMGRSTKKP
jgi:hypothetical protein